MATRRLTVVILPALLAMLCVAAAQASPARIAMLPVGNRAGYEIAALENSAASILRDRVMEELSEEGFSFIPERQCDETFQQFRMNNYGLPTADLLSAIRERLKANFVFGLTILDYDVDESSDDGVACRACTMRVRDVPERRLDYYRRQYYDTIVRYYDYEPTTYTLYTTRVSARLRIVVFVYEMARLSALNERSASFAEGWESESASASVPARELRECPVVGPMIGNPCPTRQVVSERLFRADDRRPDGWELCEPKMALFLRAQGVAVADEIRRGWTPYASSTGARK